jgi:hypothetical protein
MQSEYGKILIIIGIVLVVVGLIASSRLQIPWLGRLPGDIHFRRDNVQIYIPIVTSILLSILLTIIINIFRK